MQPQRCFTNREAPGTLRGTFQGPSRDPQGHPGTLQGSSKDPPGTFKGPPGTLQGSSGGLQGPTGISKELRNKQMQSKRFSCSIPGESLTCLSLQWQQHFAALDPPGPSRDPEGSPTSSKGPSRDPPGNSRDALGIPRERPGTHRDLQGPSRDGPGTAQGISRDAPGTFRNVLLA